MSSYHEVRVVAGHPTGQFNRDGQRFTTEWTLLKDADGIPVTEIPDSISEERWLQVRPYKGIDPMEEPEPLENQLEDMTVKETLSLVKGDDDPVSLAAEVLDIEQMRANPRTGLLAALTEIVEKGTQTDPE